MGGTVRPQRPIELPTVGSTRRQPSLDVGQFNKFQGLERDFVVVLEPTEATSPPALHRPSGASSLPRSDLGDASLSDDLRAVLRIAVSRARSRVVVIGGAKLGTALELPASDRPIRAQAHGRDDIIEISGVDPERTARAHAARRRPA
jgi:hypothetical protein